MNLSSIKSLFYSEANAARHPAADAYRVMSMLGVMGYHIWQQSWLEPSFSILGHTFNCNYLVRSGFLFVDVFLFLSAFLLFMPYARCALSNSPWPSVLSFYKKRAVRILPSYWLCVIVLFAFALAGGKYASVREMLTDLLSHLTFTHMLRSQTYLYTNLNPALWTIAVEVIFYIVFPFLARAFRKLPAVTYAAMVLCAFLYRNGYVKALPDTTLYINQFPAMLDLFANGMLSAYAYVALADKFKKDQAFSVLSTVAMGFVLICIHGLFEKITRLPGYESIRIGQMDVRYPFGILLALLMIFSGFALRPVKFLTGNKAVLLFSSVSYQAYMWHSFIAEKLKEWRIPPYSAPELPQMNNEPVWQLHYTILCFVSSLALAFLLTYAFEKPLAKRLLARKRPKA